MGIRDKSQRDEEPIPLEDVFAIGEFYTWACPGDPIFEDYDVTMGYCMPQQMDRERQFVEQKPQIRPMPEMCVSRRQHFRGAMHWAFLPPPPHHLREITLRNILHGRVKPCDSLIVSSSVVCGRLINMQNFANVRNNYLLRWAQIPSNVDTIHAADTPGDTQVVVEIRNMLHLLKIARKVHILI